MHLYTRNRDEKAFGVGGGVDWKAASGDGGRSWTHNFNGTLRGDMIVGQWAANPPGDGRGDLSVYVVESKRFDKVPETGGGFGGSAWTRA